MSFFPATALYTSQQMYAIEAQWFDAGHDSFGLMQQAAWQMAHWIQNNQVQQKPHKSALVWVGAGNNAGDGWLVAHYLHRFGWQVTVIEVAEVSTKDAQKAKKIAINSGCPCTAFSEMADNYSISDINKETPSDCTFLKVDIQVDALFGIGLDKIPTGEYVKAINLLNTIYNSSYNQYKQDSTVISVDIPSGLVASTGQVFDNLAVRADITLCLIANKLGLFTKDGRDYSGKVITLPLIPLFSDVLYDSNLKKENADNENLQIINDKTLRSFDTFNKGSVNKGSVFFDKDIIPVATRLTQLPVVPSRNANAHKGSFGHVLVIGGNKTQTAQGMGGAAILSASGAFSVGAGKVSVACHSEYHGALLARLPNCMTLDLHRHEIICAMMKQVDVVAIGMGLGRDDEARYLFEHYLTQAIDNECAVVIDADGLYHLVDMANMSLNVDLLCHLSTHANTNFVAFTPHSGEMALLLNLTSTEVESNRLSAITQAAQKYGGNWLLKGAGSLMIEDNHCYLCDAGNAGMASAGMGDVLSGMIAAWQAQNMTMPLSSAVMLHALAGDELAQKVGQYTLQAQDMPRSVADVLSRIDNPP